MDALRLVENALKTAEIPAPYVFHQEARGDTAFSCKVAAKGLNLFAKCHKNADILMSEADGLSALSAYVRVPHVEFVGEIEGYGVLLMEWLPMRRPANEIEWCSLADHLAGLHVHSCQEGGFGFPADNYIGGSVQRNRVCHSWRQFFVEQRLAPQLGMAKALPAKVRRDIERVMGGIEAWLPEQPCSALLHGDFWSGNLGLHAGEPIFYDPACYYGDPQVDLAMMALFGHVPDCFYHAYQGALPDSGQRSAWRVYDLYHLLNHFNLFGAGYAGDVARVTEQILRH